MFVAFFTVGGEPSKLNIYRHSPFQEFAPMHHLRTITKEVSKSSLCAKTSISPSKLVRFTLRCSHFLPFFPLFAALLDRLITMVARTAKETGVKLALGEAGLEVYTGAANDPKCVDRDSRVVYRYLGGKE